MSCPDISLHVFVWNIRWSFILLPNFTLLPNVLFDLINPEYMKSYFILLLSMVGLLGFASGEQEGSLLPFSQSLSQPSPVRNATVALTDSVWVHETRGLMEALAQMTQPPNRRPIPVNTDPGDYPMPEICHELIFEALSGLGVADRDVQAWEAERKRIVQWDSRFFGDGFQLVPADTIQAILKERVVGWLRFYEEIGYGFMTFSPPVFFSDYQYALIYASENCGFLCGSGTWYVLKREDDQWIIVNRQCNWIS